jgi:predicted ATPase
LDKFVRLARHVATISPSVDEFDSPVLMAPVDPGSPGHNLPAPLTSLVNRRRDIAALSALIVSDAARLVTLIGPPGIGKTRLSIECGSEAIDHFPDGVWFVDLSTIHEAAFVLPAIRRALENFELPPAPTIQQLIGRLKDKQLLLVLDNFEQVVDGAVADLAELLKNCPTVKVIATSRMALHIYGEHEYVVPPLSIPPHHAAENPATLTLYEAVQLFVVRVNQHQPGFTITAENAAFVVEVCSRMDGIPLALELAAATLRRMTLEELVAVFRDQGSENWLARISDPARDRPPRQRTLEAVVSWSYTLLSFEQQEFLCKLSVFSNWFDSEAAAAIWNVEEGQGVDGARSLLDALTDHSLLVQGHFAGQTYWRMLDIIHEFAAFRLGREDRAPIEPLHARFYLRRIQNIAQHTAKKELDVVFQVNADNLHGALQWAITANDQSLALLLTHDLHDLWGRVGYFREGLELIRKVLALPDETDDPVLRNEVLRGASTMCWQQHDLQGALTLATEAAEVARTEGLADVYPASLNLLGRIHIEEARYDDAALVLNECVTLSRRKNAIVNLGWPLAQLGEVALAQGALAEAQSYLEEALGHLKDNDDIILAMTLTDLAEVGLAQGDWNRACHWLRQALIPSSGHIRRLLCFLSGLAGFHALNPDGAMRSLRRAVQFYGAVERIAEHSGVVLSPFYKKVNQQRVARIQQQIPEDGWQVDWESGHQWKKDVAIAEAEADLG